MDLLFLDDITALRITDVYSKYSILTRIRSKNPQEVREVREWPRGARAKAGSPRAVRAGHRRAEAETA